MFLLYHTRLTQSRINKRKLFQLLSYLTNDFFCFENFLDIIDKSFGGKSNTVICLPSVNTFQISDKLVFQISAYLS